MSYNTNYTIILLYLNFFTSSNAFKIYPLKKNLSMSRGSWDIPNMDCEPGKSKWLAKGNPKEMPYISDFNCHERVTKGPLSELTCVSIHTYHTPFPPNKHFTCFKKRKKIYPCHCTYQFPFLCWVHNIPLCSSTTICLSIHYLIDIWDVSSF